jgi:hypothetical protein
MSASRAQICLICAQLFGADRIAGGKRVVGKSVGHIGPAFVGMLSLMRPSTLYV